MKNSFTINDTKLSYTNEKREDDYATISQFPHYKLFNDIMAFLGQNGFYVTDDKYVNYTIRHDYKYGHYDNLEFKAHRYPNGFEITFFQNINFENKNGGRYDFDKYEKMPYLIKLQFRNIMKKLIKFLENNNIENKIPPDTKTAIDFIKYDYVKSFHKPPMNMNFELSDFDGETFDEYNSKDKNGKILRNGDIKYFYDYTGRLFRGKIYHNINNMWWVIIDKYTVRNKAGFELFDAKHPSKLKRRYKTPNIPKEYKERREALSKTTDKELINELKRRGYKTCLK